MPPDMLLDLLDICRNHKALELEHHALQRLYSDLDARYTELLRLFGVQLELAQADLCQQRYVAENPAIY